MTKIEIFYQGNSIKIEDSEAHSLRWGDQFKDLKDLITHSIRELKTK